jgi:hypothetical protein
MSGGVQIIQDRDHMTGRSGSRSGVRRGRSPRAMTTDFATTSLLHRITISLWVDIRVFRDFLPLVDFAAH